MIAIGDDAPIEDAPEDQSLGSSGGLPDVLSEAAVTLATGVPPQIQRSFFKAVGRVFTAGAEWPAKYLEGKGKEASARAELNAAKLKAEAADIVSQQKARDVVNRGSAKAAAGVFAETEMAQRAAEYHGAHILREQSIREDVIKKTAEHLNNNPPQSDSKSEIDEDWLSAFLKEASTRSSEEYKDLFSRILSGEIKNPGSFSIGTIQSIARMSPKTATIFQVACNISSSLYEGITIRIISEGFCDIGHNNLSDLGFTYSDFSILVEEGLMRPELSERSSIRKELYKNGFVFKIAGKEFFLRSSPSRVDNDYVLQLSGPSFTNAGCELQTIVSMEVNDDYINRLAKWLKSNEFELYMVSHRDNGQIHGIKVET